MTVPKTYTPKESEEKWYKYWLDKGYFYSKPDYREAYTVVIPPPNVTGVLHMGHMLNNTIQDVLVRRARMLGKNACWVPGTDHASIATEAKVVQKLRNEGIDKHDLTREEFLKHAFEWKDKHGGIILEQLKKLGCSCDWNRTSFTMDTEYSKSVIKVFIDLYNKGYIYRSVRMVNWDPLALTAVSDEEVIYKEVNSKLFYVRYQIVGTSNEFVTIATTRPETILGDSAICINPNDERYKHLHGKKVIVPIAHREIPIIEDEYVDIEFGTGCLKVTPAHDINDYELGIKHNLETIDIFNDNGTLNKNGLHYEGKDRFQVRKEIEKELDQVGALVKTEDYVNKVGYSERTDCVIEPKLSLQWFVKMEELSKPAYDSVKNGEIKFHPEKFQNSYFHWLKNVKDWCISRQLWWGHRIPAFYFGNGINDFVIAKDLDEAVKVASEKLHKTITKEDLRQDEDVLDTWFSSWLWPISVFNGLTHPNNEEINYYYPTNDLVTAPEIMFFWVARMIIAGYEYMGTLPFKNVYFTGIVRDKLGRKMSKSLGNSPDPIELIDKYGADGVRVGILISSPAGNDLPFDISQCEQGRNFANKIWNAFRLVEGWEIADLEQPCYAKGAIEWFENRFQQQLAEIDDLFDKFRISEALMTTYKLVWDDFCAWYLEIVKPEYQKPIDKQTYQATIAIFKNLLKIIQPFMPFIAQELWNSINEDKDVDIINATWPELSNYDKKIITDYEQLMEIISNIRNFRNKNGIANKTQLELFIKSKDHQLSDKIEDTVIKLGNISKLDFTSHDIDNSNLFIVKGREFFIPFGDNIDITSELEKLKKELDYTKGFLISVRKKLENEKFVANAPQNVIDIERKKEADALQKINILEDKINVFE